MAVEMDIEEFDGSLNKVLLSIIEDEDKLKDFVSFLGRVNADGLTFEGLSNVDTSLNSWFSYVGIFQSKKDGHEKAFVWLCLHTTGHVYPEAVRLKRFVGGDCDN